MAGHDPKISPFQAVAKVLDRELGLKEPSNLLIMLLIEAVRDNTPPPREVTIGMLSRILQALGDPYNALPGWAARSSREITKILSRHPMVKQISELIDNEHMWCELEGTIAGMLTRVCRGLDLEHPETQIEYGGTINPDNPLFSDANPFKVNK